MITLANLAEKSAQEVFDYVKNHLLQQNRQSIHYGKCYYRLETPEGVLKCAAGCLISDDEYMKIFEESTWAALAEDGLVPKVHVPLIYSLQKAHDDFNPSSDNWEDVLKQVAKAYKLNYV